MELYSRNVEKLDENELINLSAYSDDQLRIYFKYNDAQIEQIRQRHKELFEVLNAEMQSL